MFMLEDLTDDQLAEYHLAWAPDGGPSLVYDNHYDIAGVLFEDIQEQFADGVSKDAIVLWLHTVASEMDEADEEIRQWRIQHPIRHAVAQLGQRMALWAHRPWMESIQ